ncbi:MAG: hypothetical protein K0A90_06955, partial [Methanosarcinaceae archaeon]|nr:hypothetical protein [Methanosarcinaceae archaeon]
IKLLTAARYIKGYERLEPDVVKVASPVLRRGGASNRSFLFGVALFLVSDNPISFAQLFLKHLYKYQF